LPSPDPGVTPSPAGVFVLLNAEGITDTQEKEGVPIAVALANDLLLIMQGQTPPTDKSHYPHLTPQAGRAQPTIQGAHDRPEAPAQAERGLGDPATASA
jgi:hypothetical protein